MSAAQIVLLILGVILFIFSFLIPEKKEALSVELKEQAAEEIRKLVKEETDTAKENLQDTTEETVQYAIEKTERAIERVTNEKVMAIGEYAETIMDDINKSHKEVLFVYDMINDKQEVIKKTVSEAHGASKKLEQQLETVNESAEGTQQQAEKAEQEMLQAVLEQPTEPEKPARKTTARKTKSRKQENGFETLTLEELASKGTKIVSEDTPTEIETPIVDMPFLGAASERGNSNEKILEMHRAGKSNMAIAKELGLGIGEVKIVIDLFEGMR